MPTFPRFTATTPPPRSSGLAEAPSSAMAQRTYGGEQAKWSGVGAFGRGMSQAAGLAFQAQRHRQALDDDVEMGMFSQKRQERRNLAVDEVTNFDWNSNMPELGTPEYYQVLEAYNIEERDKHSKEVYDPYAEDIEKQIASIKSPRVKAAAEKKWMEEKEGDWQLIRHKSALNQEDYVKVQMTKMGETAARNGDLDTANEWADRMDKENLLTSQAAAKIKEDYKVLSDTAKITGYAEYLLDTVGYQSAKDYIMAQPVDTDIQKKVLTDINFKHGAQQDALKARIFQEETEIDSNLSKGLPVSNLIDLSHMSADDKYKWRQREFAEADRRAKGIDYETDQLIKGQLETMALRVEGGKVGRPEFQKRLREEFLDKHTISKNDYDWLYSLGETKFGVQRADEMVERMKAATYQLLSVPGKESAGWTELVKGLSQEQVTEKDELRKLESDNLDRYRRSLKVMVEEHSDWTGADIYTEGRKLLSLYRKTPEQLKEELSFRTTEETARERMKQAVRNQGQEELKKAKVVMSEKYSNQLDYLSIAFNLNEAEKQQKRVYVVDSYPPPKNKAEFDDILAHISSEEEKDRWFELHYKPEYEVRK